MVVYTNMYKAQFLHGLLIVGCPESSAAAGQPSLSGMMTPVWGRMPFLLPGLAPYMGHCSLTLEPATLTWDAVII